MKFPNNMGNMGQMFAQAQKMQADMKKLQEQLAVKEFQVESAGGRIQTRINGKQEILSLKISKEIVDPQDVGLLEDMLKVALNEAIQHSQNQVASEMSKVVPPGLAGLI